MAVQLPKMGLRVFNLLSDLYDHAIIANNWLKLEYHDHTQGRGVPIPTGGLEDGAITAAKLAPGVGDAWTTLYANVVDIGASQAAAYRPSPGTQYVFYLEGGVTYRLKATLLVSATAPAANFDFGLYPAASFTGTGAITYTAGTVVAGSTVTINTPAANSAQVATSSTFVPAAGFYTLLVHNSATTATSSYVGARIGLQKQYS